MSQLSRPYQIGLGAMVVLALAWFLVFKPSDDADVAPPPATSAATQIPGAAGLGTAVDKANGAATASKSANAAVTRAAAAASDEPPAATAGSASTGTANASATGAPATSTTAAGTAPGADPSAPILREVEAGKVAVLLFFSPDGADDRAVRRALLRADRHGGKVVVRAAPIARVAEYAAITQGVDVLQAPTLLVIDKAKLARTLVGFTDTKAIDQLVSDVGGPEFVARRFTGYRGRIENLCAIAGQSFIGNALNGQDIEDGLKIMRTDFVDARRDARRLEAPRRYFDFQRRLEESLDLGVVAVDAMLEAIRAGQNPLPVLATYQAQGAATEKKLRAAAEDAGISKSC